MNIKIKFALFLICIGFSFLFLWLIITIKSNIDINKTNQKNTTPTIFDRTLKTNIEKYSLIHKQNYEFSPINQSVINQHIIGENAQKIEIPLLKIDSKIEPLKISNLNDSRSYESPNKIVGHLENQKLADGGNIWLFGHLESPLTQEGSVFKNLPDVSTYLDKNEPIIIFASGEKNIFVYEIVETEILSDKEFKVYNDKQNTMYLVTCIPKWIYDHRYIAKAELKGMLVLK